MPLEPTCRTYLGQRVHCLPINYYDWNRHEPLVEGIEVVRVPDPFGLVLKEPILHGEELKGFVGIIEEKFHLFDQQWIACCIRDSYLNEATTGKMNFDLASNLAKFNVVVGPIKPEVSIDYAKPMIEWISIGNNPHIHGFAYLSEAAISLEQVQDCVRSQRVNELVEHWFAGEYTMFDACTEESELAWKAILEISKRDLTQDQVALLAGGPIETLLCWHGGAFIDRVVQEAERNVRFKNILGGVWKREMSNDVWERIQQIRSQSF